MTEEFAGLREILADRYRIERELGRGGMATVYLGHDARHDRAVAIKVLKPEVAAAIGAERFLREIRVTAALQHPHILPLYDSGVAAGLLYYVMSYVEGESLRERLRRDRQLSIEDAIRITREVASALDFAHRHGVVHRDIKPENILLQDGQALVADFGIAYAAVESGTQRLTESGLTIGTPQYMSPEQAMGERVITGRADIFSLGTILFEMLTGDPPFTGSTVAAIVARVMTEPTPSVIITRDTVPPGIAVALEKALAKLPADRFPTAAAFSDSLALPTVVTPLPARAATSESNRPWLRDWRSWIALAAAASGIAFWEQARLTARTREPVLASRFEVTLPSDKPVEIAAYSPLSISRDGQLIAYTSMARDSSGRSVTMLFVRRLDRLLPIGMVPPRGTSSYRPFLDLPFVSPDNRSVGFYFAGWLWKVAVDGGSPARLAEGGSGRGRAAAWLDDGTILFASGPGRLSHLNGEGGAIRQLAMDSAWAFTHLEPLPGSARVLGVRCPAGTCEGKGEGAVIELRTGKVTRLASPPALTGAWYVEPGSIAYIDEAGAMWVAGFDARSGEQSGPPVPMAERSVPRSIRLGPAASVSRNGTAVILEQGGNNANQLVLVGRNGTSQSLGEQRGDFLYPRWSPDGRRIAVEMHDEAGGQIWIMDPAAGTLGRLAAPGHNSRPAWSPDGRNIAFTSLREGGSGIYAGPIDGSAPERKLAPLAKPTVPLAWSPDGRWIVYPAPEGDAIAPMNLFTIAPGAPGTPRRVFDSPGNENRPVFSTDGQWLAYTADESGRDEVYVRRFDGTGGRLMVSNTGGAQPTWSSIGKQLFYMSPERWMNAATLEFRPEPHVVGRERLFSTEPYALFGESSYDVHPDGRRFVMVRFGPRDSKLVVVLNWAAEFAR